MKKFFLFLALVCCGAWAAQYFGFIKVPLPAMLGGLSTQNAQRAQQGGGPFGGRRPARVDDPPVLTAQARRQDVPITFDAVGTIQALNTVLVRSQVDGKLVELAFKDGQDVKKGDVLARIDPAIYQAQYDQAVAKKAQDEATLANARVDLDRYTKLAATNFGSKQQADTQKALVAQLEAQVRADQASMDNVNTTLSYTTIVAPLTGRTGIRAVDVGNILKASDATGIVTITQVQPISSYFSLPQQQLRAVNAGLARGEIAAQALEDDNSTVIDTGKIDVVDNQVDSTTGTVKVKAVFPNAAKALWPGQFVNVRIFIDVLKDAIVVPTAAVQRGPKGPYVYIIGDDRKATQTDVTVGRQDERLSVILAGVAPGARVVTTGFSQFTDGAIVRPTDESERPATNAAPAGSPPTQAQPPRDPAAGAPGDPAGRRQGGAQRGNGQGGGQRGPRDGGGNGANANNQGAGAPTTQAGAAAATQ